MVEDSGKDDVALSPTPGEVIICQSPASSPVKGWTQWFSKKKAFAGLLGFVIIACIIIIAVVPSVCVLKGCPPGGETYEPGKINRLIVTFQDLKSTVKSKVPSILYEYLEEISLTSGINVVSFKDSNVLEEVWKILQARTDLRILLRDTPQYAIPRVDPWAAARRNLLRTAASRSEDELADQQWANQVVHAPEAWNVSLTQGANVVVAVIDTGCDLEHPDLKERLWVNSKEIPDNKKDDDRNNCTDDVHGYDFAGPCISTFPTATCGPRPNPVDTEGHGSHCSGIIGAVRNNSVGIAGIAPNASLMCLKVTPNDNTFYLAHIITAIDYAVRHGAHIISCSFGPNERLLRNPTDEDLKNMGQETDAYYLTLQKIRDKNMLLVAAAGNENMDLDQLDLNNATYNPCTMARYFPDNVLCVMATDEKDERLVINSELATNYGQHSVDIGAPGYQIISTVPPLAVYKNAGYANKTGSSMATPLVAGAGALIMSVLGSNDSNFFKGKEARRILIESADQVPGLQVKHKSRVNAFEAVKAAYAELRGIKELVRLAGFSVGAQTVMMPGFSEIYYRGSLNVDREDWDMIRGEDILDATTRATTNSLFNDYKQGVGTTLIIKAALQLHKPGLYRLLVSSDARQEDVLIKVGQRSLESLNSGYVLRSSGGWFAFELRYRDPQEHINITIAATNGEPLRDEPLFYVTTDVKARDYYYVPKIALSAAFQVLTNPAIGVIQPSNILPDALQLDKPYNYSAVVDDIAFNNATELRKALYRNISGVPPSILGLAYTRLISPSVPMRFKVMCEMCGLYMNDLRLLDVYDPTRGVGAVTRLSTCITFNNISSVYDLTLRFAVRNVLDTGLVISWQPCDSNENGDGAYTVTTHTVSGFFWRPSSGIAGYVPGLQCDVWPFRETESGYIGSLQGAPLLKFRFPTAIMQTQRGFDGQLNKSYSPMHDSGCSVNETTSPSCQAVLSIYLRDVFFRGGFGASSTLVANVNLRCWTYVNFGFRNGSVQAKYSQNRETKAYLGSQTVFTSMIAATSYRQAPIAPNTTALNGYYQLLVFEWFKYPFNSLLEVYSGPTATDFLNIDMTRTLLPIPLVGPSPTISSSSSSNSGRKRILKSAGRPTGRHPSHHHVAQQATADVMDNMDITFDAAASVVYDDHMDFGRSHQHPFDRLLQSTADRSRLGSRALGASPYSMSQVPSNPRLSATIYTPDVSYNSLLGWLNGTVLSNLSLNGTFPNSTTCQASAGLSGNVCNITDSSMGPRFIRVSGFLRVPGAGALTLVGGTATWLLRVRDTSSSQATMITMGDVTVRNGVEFPSYVLESEVVIMLPRASVDMYLPTVVLARSNRTSVHGRFDVSLVNRTSGAIIRVDQSMWYGNENLQ